ncbi:MAG: Mercuric ion reductase [uncultured Acidimicrobiales bacterium]|uniref:Mercuric ion reductase n=1 Tax=uncultured Acidimicrobiales bacterium TaxID=310071 RepID=A0A6J4HBQ8_9ACTN|nr:MAG: Mercuric ion reductase [uncultured Acidimicrobiales bacterium]
MADLDLVIVGMGSGGMPAAEFAATLGLKVAVVERGRVGGDCLWTGCVPSKALLSSAKVAHHVRHADRWGLPLFEAPSIDTSRVWRRIKEVQRQIATTDDDPGRYESLGVELIKGAARLVDGTTVEVGGRRLDTRFVLLCTGSRPAMPPVPGLAEAGYLTSESFFELDRCPGSLVFIGGGPIGMELAQACQRLGVTTTVLQRAPSILPRDEPELASRLADLLVEEGVGLRLGTAATAVEVLPGGRKVVVASGDGDEARFEAEEIFVCTGRDPNVEGLGLDELGIKVGPRGIETDDRGRTALKTVYAAGDVAGRTLFTHSAAYEGVRALRDMFFPGKGTVDATIPWCTFTDPELAHVGLTSTEAKDRYGDDAHVWRVNLDHNDRARAEGSDQGAVVIITGPKRRIVGGHILSPSAGELLHELALAEAQGLRIDDLAGLVHVYPTVATSIGLLSAESVFDNAARIRRVTRFLEF